MEKMGLHHVKALVTQNAGKPNHLAWKIEKIHVRREIEVRRKNSYARGVKFVYQRSSITT